MAPYTLLTLTAAATLVAAQIDYTPLAEKRFAYPAEIPFKVDTDTGPRGTQHGFNICNSTTENQESNCQTAFLNTIDDFCLWGPPEKDSTIGDTEGEAVAWCTKPGRGTRLIPEGALQGVQFMRTPDYVQVTGHIDQEKINILKGDTGGEMDPHGADLRGNPMGGLFYSNAWAGSADSYQQVIEWHNFIGSDFFCLKACDPAGPNAAHFCEHIYDRIGCLYNAPSKVEKGTFEVCEGENQDFPGIYTDEAGAVQTYTQPPEALGAISTMPYQPRLPASSNCVAHESAQLYASAAAVVPAAAATGAPSGSSGAAGTGRLNPSRTGSGSSANQTAAPEGDNGASAMAMSFSAIIIASFAITLLA